MRPLVSGLLLLVLVTLLEGSHSCTPGWTPTSYLPQTSEDNVLINFEVAYQKREIDQYAALLANDFQFYLDPTTRERLKTESWNRSEDSLATQTLFQSLEVRKVAIDLSWPARSAAGTNFLPPRNGWTLLNVFDVFLDVDRIPTGDELTTFRVEDQAQRFYFRRGRTNPPSGPGDTLVYIVEWRDFGIGNAGASRLDPSSTDPALAVQPTTWSAVKASYWEVTTTPPVSYLPQTSEDNVMIDFQTAYRLREIGPYSRLLAADFRFYFDPATQNRTGIEHWSRNEDSLQTGYLFNSTKVTRIAINLIWPLNSASPAGFLPPRETWRFLNLSNDFLDVDYAPVIGQEVTTFRVEDQAQKFYFRKGRTNPPSGPGDTLMYIVEWHDQGTGANALTEPWLVSKPAVEQTTWSLIKTRLR